MSTVISIIQQLETLHRECVDANFLNDFDKAMDGRLALLPLRGDETEPVWQLYELCRDHFFFLRVVDLKVAEVSSGLVWSINAGNRSVQLSLARSFFEHIASLCYQSSAISKIESALNKKQNDRNLFLKEINNHRNKLNKMFYGINPKSSIIEKKATMLESTLE